MLAVVSNGTLGAAGKVFLILHVGMAVIMVGAGYTYPILLARMKEHGPARPVLAGVAHSIERGFTVPFIFIQPLTGLGLILTTHNLWNPFVARNRWLFSAIVLFIIIFVMEMTLTLPSIGRLAKMSADGAADSPAFDAELTKISKVGPVFGILFLVITVLMIWKPGAPSLHF